MNTHVAKTKENSSQAMANDLSLHNGLSEPKSQFSAVDTSGYLKQNLQAMADNSPQVAQLKAYQIMANNFTANIKNDKFYNAPIHSIQPQHSSNQTVQRAGYTHAELINKIQTEIGSGICNALTAAWLAGQLDASSTDDTTGVTDANWANIIALKKILDLVGAIDGELHASDVTRAFLPYLTFKGADWFNGLAKLKLGDEAGKFGTWIRNEYKDSGGLVMQHVREDYADLTHDVVCGMIDEALEDRFTMGTAFTGIVVLAAYDEENERIGHEFSVSYTPELGNNLFKIFDQNSGLRTFVVSSDDDIADELTKFIRNGYVLHPMGKTESADIEVTFDFGKGEDKDEDDD